MPAISRFVLALTFAVAPQLLACLQSFGGDVPRVNARFDLVVGDAFVKSLGDARRTRAFWQRQKRLQAARLAKGNFRDRNDYAVTLLHLREIRPALEILLQNERSEPGRYHTAANIGTAYELAGENGQALHWIRASIGRNSAAHNGTEWLHVKILEAKLAQAADSKWLASHAVLGVDFGVGPVPRLPKVLPAGNNGKAVTARELEHALWYQLSERYQFVDAPDRYVASLLFDWANVVDLTGSPDTADALYREALRYGYDRVDLVSRRRQRITSAPRATQPQKR